MPDEEIANRAVRLLRLLLPLFSCDILSTHLRNDQMLTPSSAGSKTDHPTTQKAIETRRE